MVASNNYHVPLNLWEDVGWLHTAVYNTQQPLYTDYHNMSHLHLNMHIPKT